MNDSRGPRARSNRTWGMALGALGLVVVTSAATVLVERRVQHQPGVGAHTTADEHGHGTREEASEHQHAAEAEHGHEPGGPAQPKAKTIKLSQAMLDNANLGIRTAAPGKVAVALSLPGEVALNTERVAHVTPRVAGSVREVKRQLGDVVKKGEVLAILDSRELAEMQRDFAAAKERLELAESNFKRHEQLWLEKISAEKDFLTAKQALAEAKIEARAASQKLAAGAGARAAGGGLVLTAPLDGTIIEKHAVVGEVLSDQTLAFVVADLSTLWVNVTVYSKDLPRVHAGQSAVVKAEGIGDPAVGRVTYIDRVVGEQTRSATARIVLDHFTQKWRPGLFATAEIAIEELEAPVVVAYDALQRVEGKDVVFLREGDVFVTHPVSVGRQGLSPERLLVVEVQGISAGDEYAAENSFILKAELAKSEASHEH